MQALELPALSFCCIEGVGKWIADGIGKTVKYIVISIYRTPRLCTLFPQVWCVPFFLLHTAYLVHIYTADFCHLIGVSILYQAALGQCVDQSIACSVSELNHNRIIQRRTPSWAQP